MQTTPHLTVDLQAPPAQRWRFDATQARQARALLDAYDSYPALSPMGRITVHSLFVQLVRNRLLIADLLARLGARPAEMNAVASNDYEIRFAARDAIDNGALIAYAANGAPLPPEAFDNPDFQRGLALFLSPDGKAARFIIVNANDPATPAGIAAVKPVLESARAAVKGTPLEDARISLGGTAATFKDLAEGSRYDMLIAGIASLCLIFMIMVLFTRSLIASMVIVGSVVLSLGASFGLAVLLWQHILGIELHWMVMPMAIIVLLAVGSDYNLLLVSRFKEEIPGGLNTAIIRTMGGTGSVVTAAGLVFAFTMSSLAVSDLRTIGQLGTTIGLGLLFDTLVVRSFMVPATAALLGRWFWWPLNVRTRPVPALRR